jgi:hypothetical protein
VIVVIAAVWSLFGLWMVSRFARLKGEPRVFGKPSAPGVPTAGDMGSGLGPGVRPELGPGVPPGLTEGR